jgi:hypothetical protein
MFDIWGCRTFLLLLDVTGETHPSHRRVDACDVGSDAVEVRFDVATSHASLYRER